MPERDGTRELERGRDCALEYERAGLCATESDDRCDRSWLVDADGPYREYGAH